VHVSRGEYAVVALVTRHLTRRSFGRTDLGHGEEVTPTKETSVTPIRLAQGLAHTAVDTVRHPLTTASRAVGLAKGAASAALKAPAIVTETLTTRGMGTQRTAPDLDRDEPVAKPDPRAPERDASKPDGSEARVESAPGNDPTEPVVPDFEPPDPGDRVLVVEEALAAEQEEPRFGRVTEPHAASHDEEHGDADLQRAELEELEEEAETRE
jgi:hypothetical protein